MGVRGVIFLTGLLTIFGSCRDRQQPAASPIPTENRTIPAPDLPTGEASSNYAKIDVSPMDMSYFPIEYPKLKMATKNIAPPLARVIYSRPHLGKRRLADIVKPGKPWRMGANESTEIQFYKPAQINNVRVAPGRYILYCIPDSTKWTIVLNSNIDSWGLEQDTSKDVHRFDIPTTNNHPSIEYLTIEFERAEDGANLVISWDDVVARLPIRF